jgi:hypothetical protein
MADERRSAWRQTHHHYRLDRSCDHERRGLQRDRHCRGGARLRWPRLRARGRIGHLLGRRRGVGPESRIWGPSFFSWTRVERGIGSFTGVCGRFAGLFSEESPICGLLPSRGVGGSHPAKDEEEIDCYESVRKQLRESNVVIMIQNHQKRCNSTHAVEHMEAVMLEISRPKGSYHTWVYCYFRPKFYCKFACGVFRRVLPSRCIIQEFLTKRLLVESRGLLRDGHRVSTTRLSLAFNSASPFARTDLRIPHMLSTRSTGS